MATMSCDHRCSGVQESGDTPPGCTMFAADQNVPNISSPDMCELEDLDSSDIDGNVNIDTIGLLDIYLYLYKKIKKNLIVDLVIFRSLKLLGESQYFVYKLCQFKTCVKFNSLTFNMYFLNSYCVA